MVPLTFFLIAAIIHVMFYLYGRCLLTQDAYLLALRASLIHDEEKRAASVRQGAEGQFGEKYFGNESLICSVEIPGEDVFAEAGAQTRRSGYDLVPDGVWTARARMRARHYNMPAYVRRVARIADIIGGLAGRAGQAGEK